jgi:TM2 domain-containing membrane protein YozV
MEPFPPPASTPPPIPNPGAPIPRPESKRVLCGVLAIVVGWLGIHKFVLGYTLEGVIMLLVSVIGGFLTCGLGASAVWIVGLIEGIIYLTKSDEEFVRVYQQAKRGWF